MAIRQITTAAAIKSYMDSKLSKYEEQLLYNFRYVGEACLNAGRNTDSYHDRTGNLRSSIGYVIIRNGHVITKNGFKKVLNGAQGPVEGDNFIQQLAGKFTNGIYLVVVAGMNYASYVEDKGYDVLDSSEKLAEQLVPAILTKLGFKK